jgi:hypothetical protein
VRSKALKAAAAVKRRWTGIAESTVLRQPVKETIPRFSDGERSANDKRASASETAYGCTGGEKL